jgi:hypothetical protein
MAQAQFTGNLSVNEQGDIVVSCSNKMHHKDLLYFLQDHPTIFQNCVLTVFDPPINYESSTPEDIRAL